MAIKTRRQTPPGEPAYHRLTDEKRVQIETLVKLGHTQRQIAAILGVAPSTICREKRRNKSKKGYRHRKAAAKAKWRLREKAAKRRKFTERMWTLAKEKLRKGWSFEMFSGRMRREGKEVVSAEAFYQEYYRRQKRVAEGKSDEELPPLPRAHRKRHKRGKSYKGAGRGKIPGRVDICERPKAVESRARAGHCEGDLINGLHGTGNLVTIAERMTRFTFFAYVASKDCCAVSEAILQLLGSLPPGLLKTLTFDNGKEFAKFHVLVERLGLKVYFAKPYHSWERGTNENRNGIVRKVLPKGTPFDNLTREQMERIDHMLNDRPMKCLNWRTPREAFERLVKQALEEEVA